jgi:ABC-type sugar transport system ATPase subunit
MAKFIKKNNYSKITFGSENYNDLSQFTEVSTEAGKKGVIGITDTNGSKRVRISTELFEILERQDAVKVFMTDTQIAIQAVPEDTPRAFEVKKGAVIYSNDLARRIMQLASDTDFEENATTRCGSIESIQESEDGSITAILRFA